MFPNTEQAEVYSDINNYLTRLYSIYYLLSMGRWLAVAYKRQHLKCEVTFRFVEFFPASFTSHPLPSVWTRQADLSVPSLYSNHFQTALSFFRPENISDRLITK